MVRLLSALVFAGLLAVAAPALADPPPVEDYGKLPAMDMVTLSPDGDRYAFVADDAQGTRDLFVLTTDNKPLKIVPIGPLKVRALDWAGDDLLLISISKSDKWILTNDNIELQSILVFNLKTRTLNTLFDHNKVYSDVILGGHFIVHNDDHWYLYAFASPTPMGNVSWYRLLRIDLESREWTPTNLDPTPSSEMLLDLSGKVVARVRYDAGTETWRLLTGPWPGQERESGQDALGGPHFLGFGRTEDTILVREPNGDHNAVEELTLAGGPAKPAPNIGWDDKPIINDRTKLWIGVLHDGDQPTPSFFDPAAQAKVAGAFKAFPGYRVRLESWSDDFNHLIMFTDGGDDSGTYWIVDIAKGSANILGSAYPAITQQNVAPVRMVDWRAGDGWPLRGVLTLPPGRAAKDLPVVVMPHGGPAQRDRPGFDWWAQAFASRGYAVFQPNFRGSTGYGQGLHDAGYGQWGRKMQTDISDGVAELARQGIVDPKRACIVGASYGGYAALAGVTLQQGLYKCAVSMAGLSDPWRMLFNARLAHGSDYGATRELMWSFGAASDADRLKAISPLLLADQADAPILLIHGDADSVVPIDQTDRMEAALKAAGKPVERLTLPGADHWLLEEDARVAMVKASVAFVEKYDPPDPAPVATASAAPSNPSAPGAAH